MIYYMCDGDLLQVFYLLEEGVSCVFFKTHTKESWNVDNHKEINELISKLCSIAEFWSIFREVIHIIYRHGISSFLIGKLFKKYKYFFGLFLKIWDFDNSIEIISHYKIKEILVILFKITNSSENHSHSVSRIPDLVPESANAHLVILSGNTVPILIKLLENSCKSFMTFYARYKSEIIGIFSHSRFGINLESGMLI